VDAASGSLECTAQLVEPLPENLVPGMAVDVRLPGAVQGAGDLVLPAAALRNRTETSAEVFVVQGERLQKRSVKTGRETAAGVQVLSGVAPGERIVARTTDNLKDAMLARVRP